MKIIIPIKTFKKHFPSGLHWKESKGGGLDVHFTDPLNPKSILVKNLIKYAEFKIDVKWFKLGNSKVDLFQVFRRFDREELVRFISS